MPGTQAIDRAAQLLVRVVESARPLAVGELADGSGLPKSTTSRLVRALEGQGLVQRDGDRGAVRPGPVLLGFVQLSQRDSRHFIGSTNWVGKRVPYHLTANGKVFLAWAAAAGDHLTEPELARIRERGYSTAADELEVGLSALAAPVFGADGTCLAAISISGPTLRLTKSRMEQLAPALMREAQQLSTRLGHQDMELGAA